MASKPPRQSSKRAASRSVVDFDPRLVADATECLSLGLTRRARPKSFLRRPPRARRRPSEPRVLSLRWGSESDCVRGVRRRVVEFCVVAYANRRALGLPAILGVATRQRSRLWARTVGEGFGGPKEGSQAVRIVLHPLWPVPAWPMLGLPAKPCAAVCQTLCTAIYSPSGILP